jgi:DNA-binding NarL/FixJ family response regulator
MAVTAYAAKGDEERIRDAGAEGYVSKPISVIRFVEAVSGLLAMGERARLDEQSSNVTQTAHPEEPLTEVEAASQRITTVLREGPPPGSVPPQDERDGEESEPG